MLPTDFWMIVPAPSGVGYWAYPVGNPPAPAWSTVPNVLNQVTSYSVNVLTTYISPTAGCTCVLNGTLPAGWTFNGTTLSYNGTSINATEVSGLTFTATLTATGLTAVSNAFSLQGVGAPAADTFAPTVPLGVSVSEITQNSATVSGFPSSDPSPPATIWSGLQQYNVAITGAAGTPFTISSTAGNQPIFLLQDIGAPSPASTLTQTGADLAMTSYGTSLFGTADQCGMAAQQLTGTSWALLCKISAFTSTLGFAIAALAARNSLAAGSQNVAVVSFPFSQGYGVVFQNRAAANGTTTQAGSTANTVSPIWLALVRSGDTYTGYWSKDGNAFSALGSSTQVMGSTLYVGPCMSNNAGGAVQVSCTFQQVSLQTLANWSLNLTGLAGNTSYPITVTAQDTVPNVSAASASVSFTTAGSGSIGSDPFPRTFLVANGGTKSLYKSGNTNAGVPFATLIAQYNAAMLGFYLGFEADYSASVSGLVNTWKTGATANGVTLRVVQYTSGWAPLTVAGAPAGGAGGWLAAALNASNMWAYTSAAGSGGSSLATLYSTNQGLIMDTPASTRTVPSFTYQGKTGMNVGLNVWQTYCQYWYDVYIAGLAASKYGEFAEAACAFDGLFFDNMYPSAVWVTMNATWNGWGTTPVGNTASTIAGLQQGAQKLVAAMQPLSSGMLIVGNTAWANISPALDPSNKNLWPAVFQEEEIGLSNSIETYINTPPGQWMQNLIAAEATVAAGGTLILHQVNGPNAGVVSLAGNQSTWGAPQWQAVRFGFAAAMQRNWHYAFNCGPNAYSSWGLLDEQVQTIGGTANYGWLSAGSQRLDPPQSAAWSNGVWRRRFPNGWVLWNPRGNGAQTVSVTNTLKRIATRGYGDATVNTGATVSGGTVTLQDADGLFLIGTG